MAILLSSLTFEAFFSKQNGVVIFFSKFATTKKNVSSQGLVSLFSCLSAAAFEMALLLFFHRAGGGGVGEEKREEINRCGTSSRGLRFQFFLFFFDREKSSSLFSPQCHPSERKRSVFEAP